MVTSSCPGERVRKTAAGHLRPARGNSYRDGIRPDSCIVPEPTNLDLVPANGGALTFRLHVPGAAVHASRRAEGVSAIEKFIPTARGPCRTRNSTEHRVDPLMDRWPIAYPLSIGTVHAGDWASTVPDLLIAAGRLGVALDEEHRPGASCTWRQR